MYFFCVMRGKPKQSTGSLAQDTCRCVTIKLLKICLYCVTSWAVCIYPSDCWDGWRGRSRRRTTSCTRRTCTQPSNDSTDVWKCDVIRNVSDLEKNNGWIVTWIAIERRWRLCGREDRRGWLVQRESPCVSSIVPILQSIRRKLSTCL